MSRSRTSTRRQWLLAFLGLAVGLGIVLASLGLPQPAGQAARTPAEVEITRAQFAELIERLSEPEGYFDTDNFISNETSYLHVVPSLKENVSPGGAYFGVGPDQNFSYIVHSNPSIAIIADIRRQNMLQHLIFKVLIEEASDRYDFLCDLFSRDCPSREGDIGLGEMLFEVRTASPNEELFQQNLGHVNRVLLDDYGLSLTALDRERIAYVYRSFFEAGLGMRFSTLGRPSVGYPSFEELIRETDLDNQFQSYLSDDVLFSRLQQFQRENRLIPIVGDFAGTEALKATAEYLEENELEVSVFYASNVEFYLFGLPEWQGYVSNVEAFPFTDDAVFIRTYFPTFGPLHPQNQSRHRPTSLIQPVRAFLDDVRDGRQKSYWDVVGRNLIPY